MENMQTIESDEIEYKEDELKAQEKLNLRREARRRKILENAKNRLDKLNGRVATADTSTITAKNVGLHEEHHKHGSVNGPNLFDNVEFSDPEVEPDIIPQQLLQNESPTVDMGNLFSSLNVEKISTQQKRHTILSARLHLIISALVSCILVFYLHESISLKFSIFIPAGLCVIIDLLFFREQQPLNPIINLVITMCDIRLPSQTKNVFHLISIIQSLVVDLGVFIFSFCVFACGLVYANSRFNGLIEIK